MQNLLKKYGAILVAVLVVVAVTIYALSSGKENYKATLNVNYGDLSVSCNQYRDWLTTGELSKRLGGNIDGAVKCANQLGAVWYTEPTYTGCTTLRKWLSEGTLTQNLNGDIYFAQRCADIYRDLWYPQVTGPIIENKFNEPFVPQTLKDPLVEKKFEGLSLQRDFDRCMVLRNWYHAGNLTARLGSGVAFQEAIDCSNQYRSFWPIKPPKFERCFELKGYANRGELTSRLGGNINEAIECSRAYKNHWFGWSDFERCYDLKKMLMQGTLTANLGGNISEAVKCASDFDYMWFANLPYEKLEILPYVYNDDRIVPLNGGDVNSPRAGYESEVVTANNNTNPFKDVDSSSEEGRAAISLFNRGIVGGYSDGTFRGFQKVNRAEMSKFILLALGNVSDLANSGKFSDVKDGEWYVKYVVTAANRGIVNGYSDGTFGPARNINTVEFLKMLTFAFNLDSNLNYSNYKDVDANAWYAQYAGVAAKYNLFPNRAWDYLEPSREITRYEAVVAIYKLLNR